MSQEIDEKYEGELNNIKKIFGGDKFIREIWTNYGFNIDGQFVGLNSNINVYEACFIGLLTKTYIDKYKGDKSELNVLEIGLAYGTSSIHILNPLLKYGGKVNYTVLDPNQTETWKSIGINNIRNYLKTNENSSIHVKLIEDYSNVVMEKLTEKYDIIFIDGGHDEGTVIQDLINSARLIKPNGIVIVDDVRHFGVGLALNKFTKEMGNLFSRVIIDESNSHTGFKQLMATDKSAKIKTNIYDPNSMFCYQRNGDADISQDIKIPDNRIISSFEEAIKISKSYIGGEDDHKKQVLSSPHLPKYYVPPPQVRDNIWEMSMPALENTLDYIINYLNHSCYMLCVKSGAGVLYKLEHHETANVYKPFIQKSIWQLNRNPKLSSQKRDFIKKSLQNKQLRFMQCVVKQYFAGKESFADEYVDFIGGLLLPNGVYIMNLTDSVILREDGYHPFPMVVGKLDIGKYKKSKFIPIFSLSGQKGYRDIPIPNYDDVMYGMGKTKIDFSTFNTDWEKKKTMAVFRGGPTGCGYTTETNSRLKLATIKSKYLDVGISGKSKLINTNSIRYDPKYGLGMLNTNIESTQKFMTMAEQSNNKYIIHVDGNVHAYRMLTTMATGSLILRVESEYTSWLDHILKPNVHYIPVKKDLSDLVEKIEYCIRNDDKCRKIAQRACNIARDVMHNDKLRAIFQNIAVSVCHKTLPNHIMPTKNATRSLSKYVDDMQLDIRVKKSKRCPNGRHRVKDTAKCRLTGEDGTLSSLSSLIKTKRIKKQ